MSQHSKIDMTDYEATNHDGNLACDYGSQESLQYIY